jgi:glutamyl-tRNA reductase
MEKLFTLCPDLSGPQRAAIQQFARRLQNQFLHHPRRALREAAAPAAEDGPETDAASLVETVKQIFGLDPARER